MIARTRTRSTLALAATLAALCASTPALADPPATREAALAELSGFEHTPRPAEVRSWGPRGMRFLMEIGDDPAPALGIRGRAIAALHAFAPSPEARVYLRRVAAASDASLLLRRAAFDALIIGYDDADAVAPYLRAPDARVRDSAAWALSRSRSPAARTALTEAAVTERDPVVSATLRRALQTPPAR